MQALYSALDEKRLALFESPTGTGKTLSLVVGALTWLEDKRRAAEEEAAAANDDTATAGTAAAAADDTDASAAFKEAEALPPWLAEAAAERAREARGAKEERRQRRLRKARERRDAALAGVSRAEWAARARRRAAKEAVAKAAAGSTSAFSSSREAAGGGGGGDDDEQFLIISDDDGDGGGSAAQLPNASSSTSRRRRPRAVFPSFSSSSSDGGGGGSSSTDDGEGSADDSRRIRVVVASRTHSQLSQFVGELRRTRFADAVAAVALGSRAQLCVNDEVLGTSEKGGGRAPSTSTVAERCRDLQKQRQKSSAKKPREGGREQQDTTKRSSGDDNPKKGKATPSGACGCPFRNPADPGARRAMRDSLLSRPTDVEEAAAAGRALGACPYYSARAALPDADVVFVPYAGLLSADAREAVGLKLKGAVVVVDEAHNLPAAVAAAYSARVSLRHLRVSSRALRSYLERYGPRLNPSGRRDVQMLLAVSESLGRWLEGDGAGRGGAGAGGTGGGSSSSPAAAAARGGAPPPPPPPPPPPAPPPPRDQTRRQQQRALTIDAFVSSTGLDNIDRKSVV
jgi:chromosome transmission fidelity protein 1